MIGTHGKVNGRPLEAHWKHTGYQPFLLQWHSSVHWGRNSRHTRLPRDYHGITTDSGYGNGSISIAITYYWSSIFFYQADHRYSVYHIPIITGPSISRRPVIVFKLNAVIVFRLNASNITTDHNVMGCSIWCGTAGGPPHKDSIYPDYPFLL